MRQIYIYGDNIIECERTFTLILDSLPPHNHSSQLPHGHVYSPSYIVELQDGSATFEFTFFPGFDRWSTNIHTTIKSRGAQLRESADVIVTEISHSREYPLFALEFCAALPAGNQAWQRSGRAYSYGTAKLPYLYISELGGLELDNNRTPKATRHPNPAVPFSYISFSSKHNTPVLSVFIPAPHASAEALALYGDVFSNYLLPQLLRSILFHEDISYLTSLLQEKALNYIQTRAKQSQKGTTLSIDQWGEIFHRITQKEDITHYLLYEIQQSWSKTAYIEGLTENTRRMLYFGKEHGKGVTSSKLPISIFTPESRRRFSLLLQELYPNLDSSFIQWLNSEKNLVICWIMGFKPRGDDARPDRGLVPFTRMLLGAEQDILSIVYGPVPRAMLDKFEDIPELMRTNGLWEAIFMTSQAVLIESIHDINITKKGYLGHYSQSTPVASAQPPQDVIGKPSLRSFGEHDVDTAIHLLLAKLCGSSIFEGMCNPPGGDWSGISLLDSAAELRWVSLPRVSGPCTKRPDHVFQIFSSHGTPIILSIESKYTYNQLEKHIGEHLTLYLKNLLWNKANAERSVNVPTWSPSTANIKTNEFRFASAVAFMHSPSTRLKRSKTDLNVDIIFSIDFKTTNGCHIYMDSLTSIGKEISNHIMQNIQDNNILFVTERVSV